MAAWRRTPNSSASRRSNPRTASTCKNAKASDRGRLRLVHATQVFYARFGDLHPHLILPAGIQRRVGRLGFLILFHPAMTGPNNPASAAATSNAAKNLVVASIRPRVGGAPRCGIDPPVVASMPFSFAAIGELYSELAFIESNEPHPPLRPLPCGGATSVTPPRFSPSELRQHDPARARPKAHSNM